MHSFSVFFVEIFGNFFKCLTFWTVFEIFGIIQGCKKPLYSNTIWSNCTLNDIGNMYSLEIMHFWTNYGFSGNDALLRNYALPENMCFWGIIHFWEHALTEELCTSVEYSVSRNFVLLWELSTAGEFCTSGKYAHLGNIQFCNWPLAVGQYLHLSYFSFRYLRSAD